MSTRILELRKDLKKLLGELHKVQEEYKGEPMPTDVGREFSAKAAEAEALQNEIEEENRSAQTKRLERFLREIPEDEASKIPSSKEQRTEKKDETPSRGVAGYMKLGDYVVASEAYQEFISKGAPRGEFRLVTVEETEARGGDVYVAITKEQREEIESKAVPTIGAGVIEPQRLAVMPKVTADQRLRIRDVLTVGRTTSNAISYIREESFTSGADYQAAGSVKGEATAQWTEQTGLVHTVAHWMPATTQQLADWGQLRSLIDNRLRYGLLLKEENEIIYGAGGSTAIEGLLEVSGVHDIGTADNRLTTPTLIDQIMVGNTEVYSAGFEANAVLLTPIDYEAVVLMKGDDDHYLRQVFPTASGELRVWGLDMVRTQALEGAGTVRNMIVGDFRTGAELLIREDITVTIGMKDDDFIRNLRTVLAEERIAFAIYAPKAFASLQTSS